MDCAESVIPKTLFCICCLKQTGPYVKLGACSHREYLDSFPIPNVSPPLPETVCYNCHDTLKQIARFRLQVQESFNMLEKKIESLKKITDFKKNLEMSKTWHLSIPGLIEHVKIEPEIESDVTTKMKNIKTAIKILNNNTSSIQPLTSYQSFIGLTKSLLEITSNNYSVFNTPVPPQSKFKKKISCDQGTPMLPDEIKQEPKIVAEPIVSSAVSVDVNSTENRIKREKEEEIDIDVRTSHNQEICSTYPDTNKNLSNNSVVLIQKESEMQDVSKKSNIPINNIHIENNNSKVTVLPAEIKIECDNISYGKIMLPEEMKDHPGNLDDGITIIENCLGEIKQKEYNSRTSKNRLSNKNDGISQHKNPSAQCLITIKLNRRQLLAERQKKLNSAEYLRMDYQCRHCIKGFQFKANLDDHIKRKHTMRDPETHVVCEICKQVVLRGAVREHKFRHYNRLECRKCKKRFVLFDEAYAHYSSVHAPLQNKIVFKRKLQSYLRSKVTKCYTKSNACTTLEEGSTHRTQSEPETSCSK